MLDFWLGVRACRRGRLLNGPCLGRFHSGRVLFPVGITLRERYECVSWKSAISHGTYIASVLPGRVLFRTGITWREWYLEECYVVRGLHCESVPRKSAIPTRFTLRERFPGRVSV